ALARPLVAGQARAGQAIERRSPGRADVAVGRAIDASDADVRDAIAAAAAVHETWAAVPVARRAQVLEAWADALEARLEPLTALGVWEAGRTVADAVADVREAVDFCRYYAVQARRLFGEPDPLPGVTGESNELRWRGRGPFVSISPWNFPVAIFVGQIAAALVAGNPVLAKPAEQTPLTAQAAIEPALDALARLGLPAAALQLLPGPGETVGAALTADPAIAGVVFTGSNATAKRIQQALLAHDEIKPLIAETGGQNAMIVDSTALPEQVVDAVISSGFRSAGQRCSALRVLYLQHEIADELQRMIEGAMATLAVGDPSDPATDVGPVIDDSARAALVAHLDSLHARGRRIVRTPLPGGLNGTYVAPALVEIDGIGELDREHFGPIVHVARFAIDDLDAVIAAINAMRYGLTLGIHTRIDARARYVAARARVGNVYVNRNIVGAVVGSQPFGGEGLSGTGFKAGGPSYLLRFAAEQVVTVNTAAAGGNLALLAAAERQR
ncbi:MAG TPA: L-glutamate gamma-semialdehyde dehydrogenase, partial [Burkholderiaceae bacterium]|nr:L-glutamate gamma-semialdehyde dehydrogenase [Burkholderiaceae bacterium]